MKLVVVASPDRHALERETLRQMKANAAAGKNAAVAIVPDQCSFSEEERLIGAFGVTGLGNPEVISFKRLYHRLRERFPSSAVRLTAPAREMAVLRAIGGIDKNELRLFRGVIKKRDMASSVSALITGFKRYGVTAEMLRAAEEGLEDGLPLKSKIHDCLKALESYDAFMAESGLCDADDDMSELCEMLGRPDCSYFEGRVVLLRHFSDLNILQRRCVGRICQRADSVVAAVVWADRPEFATSGKLIEGLRRTAYDCGAEFELRILPPGTDTRPGALAYLAERYYDEAAAPYRGDPNGCLSLHISKNPSDEVRHLAATIARLVKQGRRYRDITVVTRDPAAYSDYIKRIFPLYSIPVFVDAKRPLSRHSVSRFLLSALELAAYGFTHENVFNFTKNPFALGAKASAPLEDYCIEAGIRLWDWEREFTFIRGAYSAAGYSGVKKTEDLTAINSLRKRLWELIEPLRLCLSEPRTGEDYARGIYEFMLAAGLPRSAERAAREQEENGDMRGAAETRQVYNLLIDLLDDLCTVFGKTHLEPDDLCEAVKTACGAVQIGVVPPTADSVIFGDIERMKGSEDRIVFLLGLNEDVFPQSFSNDSIFTELEAEDLYRGWGIELPPSCAEKTENERLLVYEAVSSAEELLFASYSLGRPDGGNLRPSSIVRRIKVLFPRLRETEDVNAPNGEYLCATKAAAFMELGTAIGEGRNARFWKLIGSVLSADPDYRAKLERLRIDSGYDSTVTGELDPELLAKVMGGELTLSASSLDTFGGCPFAYFAQNVLRLRTVEPMNINPVDSGNMLHNIIDGFCALVVKEKGGSWEAVTDSYADEAFDRVRSEVRLGLSRQIASDPRLGASIRRIERMARKCIDEIRSEVMDELFVPTGNEVVIDEREGTISPVRITLPDGRTARFRGRIDRTDIRRGVKIEEDGGERTVDLVRIVDYKSSGKKIDFNNVLCGLQLQLFAYMDNYLASDENARPAAALYFNLTEEPVETPIGEESSEKKDRISGVAVAGRMKAHKGVAELEADEMKTVLRYVRRSMKKAAESIYGGSLPVSPVSSDKRLRCELCDYNQVCRFGAFGGEGRVRRAPDLKENEAIETMRGMEEGEESEA